MNLELIVGIVSGGTAITLASAKLAEWYGKRDTPIYDTQLELDLALNGRKEYFGLDGFNITAILESPKEGWMPGEGAQVERKDENTYVIRLDSSRRCNTQFHLDHELAHIKLGHVGKARDYPPLLRHMVYLLVHETAADWYASGLIRP